MYAMTQTPPLTLIGSAEVCSRVGIDRSTLSRWVKDGTAVPAMRMPGKTGALLFTPDEVGRLSEMYEATKVRSA